jgi:hypothetical protein
MEDTAQVFDGSVGQVSNDVADLFTPPPVQISVKNSVWAEYEPIQAVDSKQPTIFVVNSGANFLDFSQMYLYCKMKLVQPDGDCRSRDGTCELSIVQSIIMLENLCW